MNASTKLTLPGIITNLMLRSTSEVLSDGTVTFTFAGVISAHNAHLVYLLASTTDDGQERQTKNQVVFSGKGENYDWSVKQSFIAVKGGFKVVFVLNDYTVPLAAEAKREEVKQVAGITPVICIKREQRDYKDGQTFVYYISWGDYGRISVIVAPNKNHATFYCDCNVGINNWERFSKAQQIALRIVKVWEGRWVA